VNSGSIVNAEKKILVIDDDPAILRMVAHMLTDTGHHCLTFDDAKEGLASLDHAAVSLIITDILMPGMEGIELILSTRAMLPDLPIIAMSGGGRTDSMEVLHLAQRLGAFKILPKPFTRADLLGAVEQALGPAAAGT
jgi:DNA-binding NtrC family response regulator